MKTLFRIFLKIIGIMVLLVVAMFAYVLGRPETRLAFYTKNDIDKISKFQDKFKKDAIENTCAGVPEGQRFEKCFLIKEPEIISLNKLTTTGIVFDTMAGLDVLTQDRDAAKKSENEKLLTRIDFLMLRHTIRSLHALRAYQPGFPEEEKLKTETIEQMIKLYSDASGKIEKNIARMPADTGGSYKQLLVQYNAAIIPSQEL